MKTFKEYLVENKKVYNFKIKIAGELPENFEKNLKEKLDRCGVMTFEKIKTNLDLKKISKNDKTILKQKYKKVLFNLNIDWVNSKNYLWKNNHKATNLYFLLNTIYLW